MGVHARARKCKNHVYTLRDALRPTYCDHRQHTQTKVILTRTCSHKRLQAATHRLHSHAFTLFKVQAHKSTSNHKREWKHTHSYLRRRIHTVTCTHYTYIHICKNKYLVLVNHKKEWHVAAVKHKKTAFVDSTVH